MDKISCPCCLQNFSYAPLYTQERCPVLINVAYESSEKARSCVTGTVKLVQCIGCGFVFNSNFSENLVVYDSSYDNSRHHSQVYLDYLDSLVKLCSIWMKPNMTALEIGCGKGDFLKRLSVITGCRAVGYDNAYEGEKCYRDRVFFHGKNYQAEEDNVKYDLLILRHVLEHVPNPYVFMREILDMAPLRKGARLLIEVPDFNWILEKRSFFDISYEHCNYFLSSSLVELMRKIDVGLKKIINAFDDEYLVMQGIYKAERSNHDSPSLVVLERNLFESFEEEKQKVIEKIRHADNVCVWGAAGKGIIFLSGLSEDIIEKISFVVDINTSKQGRYLPLSGKRVESSEILKQAKGKLLVLIMNKIYEKEIKTMLDEMNIKQYEIIAL